MPKLRNLFRRNTSIRARRRPRWVTAASGLMALSVFFAVNAGTASAVDGNPNYGELWLYWGQSYNGAVSSSPFNVYDWMNHRYAHNGAGGGQRIGNNNGSAINANSRAAVRLFYNSGYWGPSLYLSPRGLTLSDAAKGTEQGLLLNDLRSSAWV